jgi:hypothetical protein
MTSPAIESKEWVARCSARLHAQWPSVPRDQRDELAQQLWTSERWAAMDPEVAAVTWLRQGIPAGVERDVPY